MVSGRITLGTKRKAIEKLATSLIEETEAKFRKGVDMIRERIKMLDYKYMSNGIGVKVWCNEIAITFDLSKNNPIDVKVEQITDLVDKVMKIAELARKLREVAKADKKRVYIWEREALSAIIHDKEIPKEPEIQIEEFIEDLEKELNEIMENRGE